MRHFVIVLSKTVFIPATDYVNISRYYENFTVFSNWHAIRNKCFQIRNYYVLNNIYKQLKGV